MIIAINTIIPAEDKPGAQSEFIYQIFSRIIQQQQHTFIIISVNNNFPFSNYKNVINEISFPKRKNLLQWFAWYGFKIPAILKKYKADVFISTSAISFASVKAKQFVIVHDLSFIHQPACLEKKEISFYKRFLPRSIKKADKIFTVSEFCKNDIISKYKIDSEKINVVHPAAGEAYKPISNLERESIKEKYSNGYEYFIYSGIIDESKNLLNVLKAFSAFKKRQKSSMQLIIAGQQGYKFTAFMKAIESFKFKNDVKIIDDLPTENLVKVIAGAYAMVYTPLYDCFPLQPLIAMKCNVPVIASSTAAMPEICADAALYANPENFKEIAVQMMQIFRDEMLRYNLIEKGKKRAINFNWDDSANLIRNHIETSL